MVKALVKTREGHGNLELLDKEVATPLDDKVKIKVHYAGFVAQIFILMKVIIKLIFQ